MWSVCGRVYLDNENVPLRSKVLVSTVVRCSRRAEDVVQIETVRFRSSLLLLMKTLQVVDCSTGSSAKSRLFDIDQENTLELDISLTSSSLRLSHPQHPWGEVLTVSSREQYQRRLPCSWGWASSVGGGCGCEGGWCWPVWENHFNTQKQFWELPVWIDELGHRREVPYGEVLPAGW